MNILMSNSGFGASTNVSVHVQFPLQISASITVEKLQELIFHKSPSACI